MRFMLLMIPRGYEQADPEVMPPAEGVRAMMAYNDALRKAGVLLAMDGLKPPSVGARVHFVGGEPVVDDGPFPDARETLGGFWIIDVKSRQEAIEWAKQAPHGDEDLFTIEVRQVQEFADFPDEIRAGARDFPELIEKYAYKPTK